MKKLAVILAMALLAVPVMARNGWTKDDKITFMSVCIEEAPTRMNEQEVLRQCSCWAHEVERTFEPGELDKAMKGEDPRFKRIIEQCERTQAAYYF